MKQPFDKREVRDSECLVYKEAGQLIAGLFSFPLREDSCLNPRVFSPNRRKTTGVQMPSGGVHFAARPDYGLRRKDCETRWPPRVFWGRCSCAYLAEEGDQITVQEPPLSGPSLRMRPSAFSLARCFSMALGVIPMTLASLRAE